MPVNKIEVGVLSDAINSAVIHFPGRKFPGVLVQGDTLKSMAGLAGEILECLTRNDNGEAQAAAESLRAMLQSRVAVYEQALKNHGLTLPYPSAS